MAQIPKIDLFLDVNMPHLEELTNQLGKTLGMRQDTQFKALRLLLCNMYIQGLWRLHKLLGV